MPDKSRLAPLPERIGWLSIINFFESKRSFETGPVLLLHFNGARRNNLWDQLAFFSLPTPSFLFAHNRLDPLRGFLRPTFRQTGLKDLKIFSILVWSRNPCSHNPKKWGR